MPIHSSMGFLLDLDYAYCYGSDFEGFHEMLSMMN